MRKIYCFLLPVFSVTFFSVFFFLSFTALLHESQAQGNSTGSDQPLVPLDIKFELKSNFTLV
jgi:hypothetical protein